MIECCGRRVSLLRRLLANAAGKAFRPHNAPTLRSIGQPPVRGGCSGGDKAIDEMICGVSAGTSPAAAAGKRIGAAKAACIAQSGAQGL